ncbi:MAG: winged helix-turn-helix transcriptional regulator [Pseudomonadales bacterium]|nr:winged helix-turn-helix transcriptional regulator [Pseudomonadales bacterium]
MINIKDPEALAAHADEASQLMRAMSNPNRLMILCTLSEGELSVGQLNDRVPLSQSALSQHLSVLRRDGLVRTRREQQSIYYRLEDGPAIEMIQTLHNLYCGKDAD